MHLRGFAAEDVKVKLDKKSNAVSVKAEKEIKDEEGNVRSFRRFERSFVLPKEADVNELKTAMAKDGTMKLTCAKKAKAVEGPTEPEDKNDANETMDRSSNNKEAEVEKDAAENKENDDVVEVAIDNSSDPVEKEAESNTDMDEVEVTMESMSVEPTPSSPFEFTVNVAGFEPENLSVEIGEDEIRVNAKREEETEDGSLETKQIAKKVKVSFDDFDIDGIFSELSKEGVLTVTIPPKMEKPVAREVPINIARE